MRKIGCVFWMTLCMLAILPAHAASWLPKPIRVSPNTWVWVGPYEAPSQANRGYRMNLGFVTGKQSVAVIDSGYSPDMAEAMLQRIREITSLPVRFVINTNSQPHRFMGNDVFRKIGAEIIASREAATRMENEGAGFAATVTRTLGLKDGNLVAPQLPGRLVEKGQSISLDLGGVSLQVTHFGRAHTRGTLVVEVAPDQTVFAGDILYSGRLLSVLPDSHITQWMSAYDGLRGLKAKRFVPGHGMVAPLSAFEQPTYRYLGALKSHMDQAVKDGSDATTTIASFNAAAWNKLANFDELAGRNASLAYLEAEADGF